ncbi:MAG: sigma-70 family RNA polymerase sigma factor [Clostridia bacterium]|nr:sigma-70 family RNA polymerase sigma factor [Clostridia bacterium]
MILFVIDRLDDIDDFNFMNDIYEEYTPMIKKCINRYVRDPYTVDDLVQDCIVKLTRHVDLLRSFSAPQQLHKYIWVTAKNTALNHLIKSSRENIIPADIADYLIDEPSENETESYVELKLTYEDAKTNLQNLSERDRDLLVMKYALELNDREIAEAFNIKESSVKMTVYRSAKKLKKEMKRVNKYE